jgi:hypothetical protein
MRIRGLIVSDVGDIPLPGARLFTNGLFGKKLLGITDRNGEFAIATTDLSGFSVLVEKPGFKTIMADPGHLDEQVTRMDNGGAVERLPDWARVAFVGIGIYFLAKLL